MNGSAATVFSVRVIATFYDAGGHLVAAQESFAMLPATVQGQANPFRIRLSNAPANIDRYELNLTWDDISIAEFDRVTVISEDVHTENGIEIVGELRNDHRSGIQDIVVVATFYDASGQIVDAFRGEAEQSSLETGAVTGYRVQTGQSTMEYDRFLVQTQGRLIR